MNKKEAIEITGGLSKPSKMPCKAYSVECPRWGTKNECEFCYAQKGRYFFPNVKEALARRTRALSDPRWVEAMVVLIGDDPYFRWHDAGDLRGMRHLTKIVSVVKRTPNTKHYLPTKQPVLLMKWTEKYGGFPPNLSVRVSRGVDVRSFEFNYGRSVARPFNSSSISDWLAPIGYACPSSTQGNKCQDCRVCWDTTVRHVTYKMH